jgi:hypothetical protein
VDVEVDHRDPFQAVAVAGIGGGDGDVVEQAKPIAVLLVAWWPGGRTAQKASGSSPSITASTAATPAPAACTAALAEPGEVQVSMSSWRSGAVCGLQHEVEQGAVVDPVSSPNLAGGASRHSSWPGKAVCSASSTCCRRCGHSGWPGPGSCSRQDGWV